MSGTKTLMDRIEHEEGILLRFWTRFAPLKAFEQELIARVGDHFLIANTVLWDAMLAERDLLVIHFASWVKGLGSNRGFFGQVRAQHFPELRKAFTAARKEKPRVPGRGRVQRLSMLFPEAAARKRLDPEDLDAMKEAALVALEPVVGDRNAHRAHPYEHDSQADVRMLNFTDLEKHLLAAQQLMNDLRLLADNSTLGYSPLSLTNPEDAAQDVVDLVLFGSIQFLATLIGANEETRRPRQFWWEQRNAFLVELARQHALSRELPMNDDSLLERTREVLAGRHAPDGRAVGTG